MGLSNEQLIHESIECNHAGIGRTTLEKYQGHLVHFAQYLASVHGSDFYEANKCRDAPLRPHHFGRLRWWIR